MANRRVGGILFLRLNGELFNAKGEATYDIGVAKREAVVGQDGVHGFKETPKVPFIEIALTDNDELDLEALFNFRDGTVMLQLANGKTIVLREAFYAGEGSVTTSEGEISARFEGIRGEEVPA